MATAFPQTLRSLGAGATQRPLLVIALAVLLLAGWLAWLTLAHVSVFLTSGPARIELDRPLHPIQVETRGRLIRSELVLDRPVKAGEILVWLEDREAQLTLDEARARMTALEGRRTALAHEVDVLRLGLPAAAAEAEAALQEATAVRRAAQIRVALANDELDRAAKLHAQGVTSDAERNRARAQAREAKAQAEADQRREEQRRAALRRVGHEPAQRIASLQTQIAGIEGDLAESKVRQARLSEQLDKLVIRARVDGRVGSVEPRGLGAVLEPLEVLGQVVEEGPLGGVAHFPVADALGRVLPGQRGALRLQGFAWTRFGAIDVRITRVALEGRDGWMRAEFEIERPDDLAFPLRHGLIGQVEAEVERITPLELLLSVVGRPLSRPRPAANGESP